MHVEVGVCTSKRGLRVPMTFSKTDIVLRYSNEKLDRPSSVLRLFFVAAMKMTHPMASWLPSPLAVVSSSSEHPIRTPQTKENEPPQGGNYFAWRKRSAQRSTETRTAIKLELHVPTTRTRYNYDRRLPSSSSSAKQQQRQQSDGPVPASAARVVVPQQEQYDHVRHDGRARLEVRGAD